MGREGKPIGADKSWAKRWSSLPSQRFEHLAAEASIPDTGQINSLVYQQRWEHGRQAPLVALCGLIPEVQQTARLDKRSIET